jgi:trans-aconitate 2-methyltransferase
MPQVDQKASPATAERHHVQSWTRYRRRGAGLASPRQPQKYALRDNELAAQRLDLIDRYFAPASVALLSSVADRSYRIAVDLGCGPGHTTQRLHRVVSPTTTIGLDTSDTLLARARSSYPHLKFCSHDVRLVPLPGCHAPDLIYARFLLTHLSQPRNMLKRWSSQLAVGGILLSDETQRVEALNPVVAHYLELQAHLIGHHGGRFFVGQELEGLDPGRNVRVLANSVRELVPPGPQAARGFALNIEAWRDDPVVRERISVFELNNLVQKIQKLADSHDDQPVARWDLRQIILERLG